MNRRTAIIATVAAAVLCGCPGLFGCLWGVIAAGVSFVPGADINIGGSSDPQTALQTGLGAACVGLILIAIPVAVGFFTLRKKPDQPQSTG
ncbi:MAG: hypothetical protein HY023_06515 [Chloroflexi bacterium]|nr:hypothetical protein [Chloroflexota bacterium]MBI3762137.1 hypothetical protein [Chloroflexota bacterium]